MRKCRIQPIKLTPANEAFLEFCQNYETADRERYRKAYERKDEREKQMAARAISLLATESDHDLRGPVQGMLGNIRTRTGTQSEAPQDRE
jgi:K+-sensing histidine kinase KdpD